MTIKAQVSVQSQVFIPGNYDVFAGLDVDKKSLAVILLDLVINRPVAFN